MSQNMARMLRLFDGRSLQYLVSGAENGFPLIWIHGTPGACFVSKILETTCQDKGVKLVSLSRAGYGDSTRHQGRQIASAVADIQALTQHLGIQKCVVAGWSGGGPHALACAARLPGCTAALAGASLAPWNAPGLDFLSNAGKETVEEFTSASEGERDIRKFCDIRRTNLAQCDVQTFVENMSSVIPEPDRQALLTDDTLGPFVVRNGREGMKHSSDGWVDDSLAFVQPWGFELDEIKVPVLVYHGLEDAMVPVAHGRWLAEHLPPKYCKAHFLDGHGHISMQTEHLDKMLHELLSTQL